MLSHLLEYRRYSFLNFWVSLHILAPSPPEEVTGIPLAPTVAEVRWEPPKLLNSERLVR